MTGVGEFTAYCSEVSGTASKRGSPSYWASYLASSRLTSAVCGMLLAITASWAAGVPGTVARTLALGLDVAIFEKSFGRSSPSTKAHGPFSRDFERYQRPVRAMK